MSKTIAATLVFLASASMMLQTMPARGATPMTNVQDVVSGNTAFATDLYSKLKSTKGNLFFSPYSISTALAMTYAGARGETAQQMARALYFPATQDRLHPAFASLEAKLKAIQKKGKVQINVANSLWPQKKYRLLPEYVRLLKRYYSISIAPLDYARAPETARKTINEWVEQKTNHKIADLIHRDALDSAARLILVDALYFKGKWADPFDPKATVKQPFHIATNADVTCNLMICEGTYGYGETPDLQALELPYMGGDLSMIILLPRKADGLSALESELTTAGLAKWTGALYGSLVDVFLPRFKLTSEFSLGDTLAAMGMSDAFSVKADFSGMDGQTNYLYISKVLHKAFVDVSEEGTEAAAATVVEPTPTGGIPVLTPAIFRADHPFLFLIRDNHTGSILFLGRVMDPA